ncbi:MAG: PTS glucose transporter subunit IIA [Erysipelotrichaceae bacterium]|nr:PTS glucose transporter subunit IIA [Erysipelotrichaceae bacterium]
MKNIFSFFNKQESLPNVSDKNLISICNGEMIEPQRIADKIFAGEVMGKTVGFIPSSNEIFSPCDGTLEVMFPTGHAFAIRMKDGTGILVHVGINTVDLNGKGFKILAKQGSKVKAGQKLLDVDFDFIKKEGYDPTIMLIITEPVENVEYNFSEFGPKEKYEIIL